MSKGTLSAAELEAIAARANEEPRLDAWGDAVRDRARLLAALAAMTAERDAFRTACGEADAETEGVRSALEDLGCAAYERDGAEIPDAERVRRLAAERDALARGQLDYHEAVTKAEAEARGLRAALAPLVAELVRFCRETGARPGWHDDDMVLGSIAGRMTAALGSAPAPAPKPWPTCPECGDRRYPENAECGACGWVAPADEVRAAVAAAVTRGGARLDAERAGPPCCEYSPCCDCGAAKGRA